jgi:hypothetical protein
LTHLGNYSIDRYKHLSDPQIDVVIDFLHVIQAAGGSEADMAEEALKNYWETAESRRRTIIHVP